MITASQGEEQQPFADTAYLSHKKGGKSDPGSDPLLTPGSFTQWLCCCATKKADPVVGIRVFIVTAGSKHCQETEQMSSNSANNRADYYSSIMCKT